MKLGFDGGIKLEFHGASHLSVDPVMRAIIKRHKNFMNAVNANNIGHFETERNYLLRYCLGLNDCDSISFNIPLSDMNR